MKSHWFKQTLSSLIMVTLFICGFAPLQVAQARGSLPAGLLKTDGALNQANGFQGALNLRGWNVSLDATRGPSLSPTGGGLFDETAAAGAWSAMGTGTNGIVYSIAISGSDVYVGGDFTSVGNCTSGCNYIAKWNGHTWSPLGTGISGEVLAIAISGSDVYAGGTFYIAGTCKSGCYSIAKWDGSSWSALGTGMNGTVSALAASGSTVYAGGIFTGAGTCTSGCNKIAKWDGSTWSALDTGIKFADSSFEHIYSIALSGSDVYVGGNFTSAGSCTSGCNYIAKWNGHTWSPLGTGMDDYVRGIAINGSNLYAVGGFTTAGTCKSGCNKIAKWNGSTWSSLNSNVSCLYCSLYVYSVAVNGNDLYVGGVFNSIGTCALYTGCVYIAKYDGSKWSAMSTGTNGAVEAIAASSSGVYAGGSFTTAGTCTSGCNYIAKYGAPPSISKTYTSTGSLDGWILESSETSGVGGSMNSTATTFQLGDDAANRQYRAILSFDTSSLPDNAIIQSATIKIKQSGAPTGTNPFTVLGSLTASVRKGFFGSSYALQLADFNAAASAGSVGSFGKTPASGWYSATVNASGRSNINKTSLTQFRLSFSLDDNNNHKADYMKFLSGNSASGKPQLIITYSVP